MADPDLDELKLQAAADLGIDALNVARDYWLTRSLYAMSVSTGGTGRLDAGHRNPALSDMVCAFTGGTSLVSAWGITQRYSEDLDLLCLMDLNASASTLRRPHSIVTKHVLSACNADKRQAEIATMGKARMRRLLMQVDAIPERLKIESVVEAADSSLIETRRVTSLMGRAADESTLARFPELGGFEMPCIVPAYTAANKLDALHKRAVRGHRRGIVGRGRDLIDLACIAMSSHAEDARARVPVLAERAAETPFGDPAPRPAGGYGRSAVFAGGTTANDALRDGYQLALDTVWGDGLPAFDEAVELAAGLDLE